jgi:hypothetical protein
MSKSTVAVVVQLIFIVCVAMLSVSVGYEKGRVDAQEERIASTEQELQGIYNLLSSCAFTGRTNMNLSFSTNRYLEKVMLENGLDPEIDRRDLIEYYEYMVNNMPSIDKDHDIYFDEYYRKKLKLLKDSE